MAELVLAYAQFVERVASLSASPCSSPRLATVAIRPHRLNLRPATLAMGRQHSRPTWLRRCSSEVGYICTYLGNIVCIYINLHQLNVVHTSR
jgi:hypothetical protein